MPRAGWAAGGGIPGRPPARRVPDAPGPRTTAPERKPLAELTRVAAPQSADDRPFPPGDYPLVVVGSGPGAIQLTYALSRLGVRHATISADDGPGGVVRRRAFLQRPPAWAETVAA